MARGGRTAFWAGLLLALALVVPALAGGSPEADRAILVAFRDSITNWDKVRSAGNIEGWDDATPAFLWTGVVMDFDLRVREIKLPCFEFMYCHPAEGPMFTDFAKLEKLETLHLSGNRFTGDLPDEWAAPGAFPVLTSLSVASGSLRSLLPRSWGNPGSWPSLKELSLDTNSLTGTLPPEWGNRGAFPRLEKLILEHNNLEGSLPASWGKAPAFPSLQLLALTGNTFSGQLPASWGVSGGFKELTALQMASCKLQGALPDAWAAPDRFPKLVTINLQANNVSGALPPAWGCDGCLPSLKELFLLNNTLGGSLPATWSKLATLGTLDLSFNRIEGPLPEGWAVPGALPQLVTLSLPGNRLSGSLPASWGRPNVLPALSWLDVSANNISGALPGEWGRPNSFPRLRLLDLKSNALSGPLPSWSFNATMQQLFTWSLAHNQLTGTLPDEWGTTDNSLSALYVLDVSYNRLNGTLPPNWGTKPSALSSLTSIAVAGNGFSGEIPKNWGFMPAMHYLVLAPGNTDVCRPLPYSGQFVTCLGDGSTCKQPVQLRSNCSSNQPGWVPYNPDRGMRGLTGLQIGLIVSGVSLVAACSTLVAVLVLRYREQRRWQTVKGLDAELALRKGTDPLADLIAATAARKRGAHNALAEKLLKECRIDQADVMFCRGTDGNLVQLGAGAYGQVYKAFLYGVHPVAVKVFQTQDDVPVADFWKEISILRTCRHNNIVQFQGACVDGDTTMMVTELMDTDLYRALQTNRVNWHRHGHDIAIDVAQALHFLHCRNIIHFDCKSPNILLSGNNTAKLADVGWAQILYHSYITGDGGTFNWAAPEQLIGLKCTAKADVYSYGLVLWELCTRELPVRGQIRDIRIPQEAPQMVADLIRECLDVDPAKRPTMEDIIHRLVAEKERLARESSSGDSSSAGAYATHSRRGGSTTSASLDGRALEGLPGASSHNSSDKSSGLVAGRGTVPGGRGGSSGAGGSSRGADPAAGSIHSSLWQAGSTPASGSQASASASLRSFDGMPVGAGSTNRSGSNRSGSKPSAGNSNIASFDGMSVGGAAGNATSSSGTGSDGGGSVFAGSAWATGKPALAATAGAATFAGPTIFEGSAWAAGRPAAALSNAGTGSEEGSLAGAPLGETSGSGGVFSASPWWNAATTASVAGGSQAGTSPGGTSSSLAEAAAPQLGGTFQESPWWNASTSVAGASTANASGDRGAGGQVSGAASLAAGGTSGLGSEAPSTHSGTWPGMAGSQDGRDLLD